MEGNLVRPATTEANHRTTHCITARREGSQHEKADRSRIFPEFGIGR